MIRTAIVDDIEQVLEIEKSMYWSGLQELWKKEAKEKMKSTFLSCLRNFPEGFFVAVENNEIAGFIIIEIINEVKTIPYVHNSEDFHIYRGMFAYVSGFGVVKESLSLELYKNASEFAKLLGCKKMIVVMHHRKRHDALETKTLIRLGFLDEIEMTDWEIYPGRIDNADIWTLDL
jgi:hypothetical protein